jgi:hypothetical protein
MDIPGKIDLKPYWKDAFVKKQPFDGVEMKEKMEDGVFKIILAINAKTTEMQFKVFRSKGFQVTHSPIKYSAEVQQIMLTFKPDGEVSEPPTVGIAWKNVEGAIVKKEVQLPIAINKFLNPVDLSFEKFNNFYTDYSLPNEKFFKLDAFVKVPMER